MGLKNRLGVVPLVSLRGKGHGQGVIPDSHIYHSIAIYFDFQTIAFWAKPFKRMANIGNPNGATLDSRLRALQRIPC